MKTCVEQSNVRYPELLCKTICDTEDSVLDMLYDSYRERHPMDTEEIGGHFTVLADILSKLSLKEHDQVWDLTCGLCTEHERSGFLAGVRMGVFLTVERMEKRCRKGSW